MATTLSTQGKYDEALGIFQDVLNIRERVLGTEHLDTLRTRNNMALILDTQGKHDEALGIYQEIFNIKERVLGGEHPDTLLTRENMALVLVKVSMTRH
jgi:tetratricopeptide (TPR) repeat protein